MADAVPRRICVFCGSSMPKKNTDEYVAAAEALGRCIVANGFELVYGGGNIGLMGVIARAVDKAGGKVIGIIPQTLAKKEVSGEGVQLQNVIFTDTMHQRKQKMAELSDSFIAMPGGYGTWEELGEMLTWTQLGIQSKAIGVLNVCGFYDHWLAMVDRGIEDGFIASKQREIMLVDGEPEKLVEKLANYTVPAGLLDWSGKVEP